MIAGMTTTGTMAGMTDGTTVTTTAGMTMTGTMTATAAVAGTAGMTGIAAAGIVTGTATTTEPPPGDIARIPVLPGCRSSARMAGYSGGKG